MVERVFTKNIGRFKQGDVKDYPQAVWVQIEKSAKKSLGTFSKLSSAEQDRIKGKPK